MFSRLPIGTYDISVELPGHQGITHSAVSLTASQVATVHLYWEPGAKTTEEKSRITGRGFLVGDSQEGLGYGLYSYVLLGSPPTEATHERVLALMREYLALPEAIQFKKPVSKGQLNVTYLPLVRQPSVIDPDSILNAYNYVRAQALLAKVPLGPHIEGPYIISTGVPLSQVPILLPGQYLYQDLSSVPSTIVLLWVHEFMKQSAKKDYWRSRNGPQAALALRKAIATLAVGVDPPKRSLTARV